MSLHPHELIRQLTEDVNAARALLDLTQREFHALNVYQIEEIQAVLAQKQPLIIQLEQHGQERAELLQSLGLPISRQGIQKLFSQGVERSQALALADTLEHLLGLCRQANERNGRSINSTQAVLAQMLAILRGTAKTPPLYDRWGSTEKTGRQRTLSQA